MSIHFPRLRSKIGGRLCRTSAILFGIVCAAGTPAAAEARPIELHTYLFTEGVAIPFTRLTGNELNPGALVGPTQLRHYSDRIRNGIFPWPRGTRGNGWHLVEPSRYSFPRPGGGA